MADSFPLSEREIAVVRQQALERRCARKLEGKEPDVWADVVIQEGMRADGDLGLVETAMAKTVVLKHGGHIWGESAIPQGASFHFTLQGRGA